MNQKLHKTWCQLLTLFYLDKNSKKKNTILPSMLIYGSRIRLGGTKVIYHLIFFMARDHCIFYDSLLS